MICLFWSGWIQWCAASTERLTCWYNACFVGGMDSNGFRLVINKSLRTSLTSLDGHFGLFIWTVIPSSAAISNGSRVNSDGLFWSLMNVSVNSGCNSQTLKAVFFPTLRGNDVISRASEGVHGRQCFTSLCSKTFTYIMNWDVFIMLSRSKSYPKLLKGCLWKGMASKEQPHLWLRSECKQ